MGPTLESKKFVSSLSVSSVVGHLGTVQIEWTCLHNRAHYSSTNIHNCHQPISRNVIPRNIATQLKCHFHNIEKLHLSISKRYAWKWCKQCSTRRWIYSQKIWYSSRQLASDWKRIGQVNEYPAMHYFGNPCNTQSMIAYIILTKYFWKFQGKFHCGNVANME